MNFEAIKELLNALYKDSLNIANKTDDIELKEKLLLFCENIAKATQILESIDLKEKII